MKRSVRRIHVQESETSIARMEWETWGAFGSQRIGSTGFHVPTVSRLGWKMNDRLDMYGCMYNVFDRLEINVLHGCTFRALLEE